MTAADELKLAVKGALEAVLKDPGDYLARTVLSDMLAELFAHEHDTRVIGAYRDVSQLQVDGGRWTIGPSRYGFKYNLVYHESVTGRQPLVVASLTAIPECATCRTGRSYALFANERTKWLWVCNVCLDGTNIGREDINVRGTDGRHPRGS